MQQNFPDGREIIRQVLVLRGTPTSALDATLASLSESTIAHYTKPLRLWWSFCMKFRVPYKAVSAQTLGWWVKTKIQTAGVDTNIFSAHSTRHASTYLTANKDISLEEIRRTAGRSKSSETFACFYNRPILSDSSFQDAILDKSLLCEYHFFDLYIHNKVQEVHNFFVRDIYIYTYCFIRNIHKSEKCSCITN
ncbi:hypothetical protein ALC62_02116 [Cyphomyrmex costatus]|uniref:Tyr recombinase domain-containing protein n=1 Tax=Cyphomyrmex costatus TaxID=456900 RepID=A0A195D210_9HYME|nr:hypothetical protein ALC62_02116 [Cyphomyrmex costatus]